jgi:hypothetical protein
MKWPLMLVVGAFRYACGRMSVVVGEMADWLITHWDELDEYTRNIIKRDLDHEFERDDAARERAKTSDKSEHYFPLGWDCDRREWERVRALWQKKEGR